MKRFLTHLALLAIASSATAQTTSAPSVDQIRNLGHELASRYENAVIRACNLQPGSVTPLHAALESLVERNAGYEASTRPQRISLANEINEILTGPQPRSPRSRARLNAIFGQLDQIYLGAPLELRSVATAITPFLNKDCYSAAGAALYNARARFVPVTVLPDLRTLAPGTPEARAALALIRHRCFQQVGVYENAEQLPTFFFDPPAAIEPNFPRFYGTALPTNEWMRYAERLGERMYFTPEQKNISRLITEDCLRRVAEYRNQLAQDYNTVNSIADAEQRAALQAELNRFIDQTFEELKMRLFNLGDYDQRVHSLWEGRVIR